MCCFANHYIVIVLYSPHYKSVGVKAEYSDGFGKKHCLAAECNLVGENVSKTKKKVCSLCKEQKKNNTLLALFSKMSW